MEWRTAAAWRRISILCFAVKNYEEGSVIAMDKKAVFPQNGSLIFFGDIFGGRYGENLHQIIDYRYDKTQEIYLIHFEEG